MRADKQTDKKQTDIQTYRHDDRNISHRYRGEIINSSGVYEIRLLFSLNAWRSADDTNTIEFYYRSERLCAYIKLHVA